MGSRLKKAAACSHWRAVVIGLAQFPVVTSTYGTAADALCMLTRSSARERELGMLDGMTRR